MKENELENPLLGYIVIAVALIVGSLAASVWGQSPAAVAPQGAVVAPQSTEQRGVQVTPVSESNTRLRPDAPQGDHGQSERRWLLGVRANPTETGYVVQRVEIGSAAEKVGLEPGDRIVTVDGRQVGLFEHHRVELSSTIERCGGKSGRIRLLVLDRRTSRLVSVPVQLRHPYEHMGY